MQMRNSKARIGERNDSVVPVNVVGTKMRGPMSKSCMWLLDAIAPTDVNSKVPTRELFQASS
jgi:hypothetical protein